MCGNSLGLQPKSTKEFVMQELSDWAEFGVEGFSKAKKPWLRAHQYVCDSLARITGALPTEVVPANSLTVNLHLLLLSFYKPTPGRFRILCEKKAFPSDLYALKSQIKHQGLNPDEVLREIQPDQGEFTISDEAVLEAIREEGDKLALVMMGGVNYYTGKVFDMKGITEATHAAGAICGFDLAHGVGNVELKLNEWDVDFACWCNYKYLNAGPGAVGGMFIHSKHLEKTPELTGWWGVPEEHRFKMEPDFQYGNTAAGWQISTPPVIPIAMLRASMDIFDEAGMPAILEREKVLTDYLRELLNEILKQPEHRDLFSIITPDEGQGAQLSLRFNRHGKKVFDHLSANNIICDWREPGVIRLAPAPLYNTCEELLALAEILKSYRA